MNTGTYADQCGLDILEDIEAGTVPISALVEDASWKRISEVLNLYKYEISEEDRENLEAMRREYSAGFTPSWIAEFSAEMLSATSNSSC